MTSFTKPFQPPLWLDGEASVMKVFLSKGTVKDCINNTAQFLFGCVVVRVNHVLSVGFEVDRDVAFGCVYLNI